MIPCWPNCFWRLCRNRETVCDLSKDVAVDRDNHCDVSYVLKKQYQGIVIYYRSSIIARHDVSKYAAARHMGLCRRECDYKPSEWKTITFKVHCVEGKDRTGFVCALMLALADASAQEIIDDYMITFDNYYGITKESDPERYDAVRMNIDDFLYYLCDADKDTSLESLDLKAGGESYLRKGGLNDNQIKQIKDFLTD